MSESRTITALFTDIGGVLLTDGWSGKARSNAALAFNLNVSEFEERHHLTFDTFEIGKISLDEYLQRVVFYEKRNFTADEFKEFMFTQSEPFPQMIELLSQLKNKYNLKVGVVSNEGLELTTYRIRKFKLYEIVDFFVSSCFVHLRKPDTEIFTLAVNLAQVPVEQIVYIEDRPMFVKVAESLGIKGIQHTNYESTIEQLKAFGLTVAINNQSDSK